MGYYEGGKLQFIATLKNGFVPAVKAELAAKFQGLERDICEFANPPERRGARPVRHVWAEDAQVPLFEPQLVTQIWGNDEPRAGRVKSPAKSE